MDWTIVASVLAVSITGGATYLAAKVQHKGRPENAMIDQLQDEMSGMRGRMDRFEARDRVYIPHIIRLNMHIENNVGPPAPKIPKVIQDYLDEQDE